MRTIPCGARRRWRRGAYYYIREAAAHAAMHRSAAQRAAQLLIHTYTVRPVPYYYYCTTGVRLYGYRAVLPY
jgi:hypothetical protein